MHARRIEQRLGVDGQAWSPPGMCAAALGSQTGGSTGRPAAYNGIVGLKPTYGRISCYGVVPLSWTLDTVGILTRSVQDAAIMLQAMAGYDRNDPGSYDAPVPDYLAEMNSANRPPRVGLVKQFFYDHASQEARDNADEVARRLSEAGASVEEIALPESFGSAHECQRITSGVEAAAFHEENFAQRPDDYGPKIRASIEAGTRTSAVRYAHAMRTRAAFRADMVDALGGVDVALTPATPEPAPRDLSTTGDPAFQSPWTSAGLPAIVIPSGNERIRPAAGRAVGGAALPGGQDAGRGALVRGCAGRQPVAAGLPVEKVRRGPTLKPARETTRRSRCPRAPRP